MLSPAQVLNPSRHKLAQTMNRKLVLLFSQLLGFFLVLEVIERPGTSALVLRADCQLSKHSPFKTLRPRQPGLCSEMRIHEGKVGLHNNTAS